MNIKNIVILLMLLCIIIVSLTFINAESTDNVKTESVNITVQVNDAIYDTPMENARVSVNGNNTYIDYTNKNGQAFFNGIPNDNYCIDGLFRNLKGHEDSLYLADSTYFVTIYISQNDTLCP